MGQNNTDEDVLESAVFNGITSEEMDGSYLRTSAVDINSGSREELERLYVLSAEDAVAIVKYRMTYGPIMDAEELFRVEGMNREKVAYLKQHAVFNHGLDIDQLNQIDKRSDGEVTFRYQQVLEMSEAGKNYPGPPFRSYVKLKHGYLDRWCLGLLLENDAGEAFLQKKPYLDHSSAYLYLNLGEKKREVILGDFQLAMGRGLAFSTFSILGKSAGVMDGNPASCIIRPNTSSNEYRYLRGIATHLESGSFSLVAFASHRMLDAGISNGRVTTSIGESGLHRTPYEIEKRSGLAYNCSGMSLQFRKDVFSISQQLVYQRFSALLPFDGKSQYGGQEGRRQVFNASTYFNLRWQNFRIYGELASSLDEGRAGLMGMSFHPGHRLILSALYRNYGRDYHSVFTSAFGEYSKVVNEEGIFLSARYDISSRLRMTAYTDVYNRPWVINTLKFPVGGTEEVVSLEYRLSRQVKVDLRWREKSASVQQKGSAMSRSSQEVKRSVRTGAEISFDKTWRWRVRFENALVSAKSTERGMLMFHELKYKKLASPYSFLFRYTVFETASYDSRIYAYEQDLPGLYYIPAHSGKGSRYFFLISCRTGKWMKLSVKFSQTLYADRQSIGTGKEAIQGPVKSEIGAALTMSW